MSDPFTYDDIQPELSLLCRAVDRVGDSGLRQVLDCCVTAIYCRVTGRPELSAQHRATAERAWRKLNDE